MNHEIHNKGQARLFKNPLLEALTKTHPLVVWGMYVPIMGWMIYYAHSSFHVSAAEIAGLFFAGMFFWTFFEYLMHRFVYHYAIHAWRPPFKWMKPLWRNHQLHHYKEQERGFGVSSTLWDHVFGTMFEPENHSK